MPQRAASASSRTSTNSTSAARPSSAAAIRSRATGMFGQSGTVSTVIRILCPPSSWPLWPTLDLLVHWKVKA
jgi:hypothetical protein